LAVLAGKGDYVEALAWAPDGSQLAVGDGDGIVQIWDAANWELVIALDEIPLFSISDLSWSPDGLTLIMVGNSKTVWNWEFSTGELAQVPIEFSQSLFSIDWSPTGEFIAVGDEDSISIVDALSWQVVGYLPANSGNVYSLAWSPDGQYLLSGSDFLHLWNPFEAKILYKDEYSPLGTVSWAPDGRKFSSANKIIEIDQILPLVSTHSQTTAIHSQAISPDGDLIAAGHSDGQIRIWNSQSGELVSKLPGHADHVLSLAWSPDGSRLASGSYDHTLRIWNIESGETELLIRNHADVRVLSWTSEGNSLFAGVGSHLVVFDSQNGEIINQYENTNSSIHAIDWNSKGAKFAVGSEDGQISIWNYGPLRMQETLEGHTNFVHDLAWSPLEDVLASAGFDGSFRTWRLKDTPPADQILICESILDTLYGIAWSPNGDYLATVDRDGLLEFHHPESCEILFSLAGHLDAVSNLDWMPGEMRLVTSSWDGTVRIWDIVGE